MNYRFLTVPTFAALCLLQANAASTSVGGSNISGLGPNEVNVITDDLGTPLQNGTGRIVMGYFGSLSDAQVDTLVASQSYSTLVGAFVGLANTTFGTSGLVAGYDGFYEINATGLAPLDYTNDGGKSMYTFYSDTASLSTATLIGLYRHNDTISAVDPFPSPDSYTLENYSASVDGNILIGTSGTTNVDFTSVGGGPTNIESMGLIAIPEPSLGLLSALGAGLFLIRRRR